MSRPDVLYVRSHSVCRVKFPWHLKFLNLVHFPRRSFFCKSSGFKRPSAAASSISRKTATQPGVLSINFFSADKIRRWSKSSRSVTARPRILAIFLRVKGPGSLRPASRSQINDGDTPTCRPSSRNVIPANCRCTRTLSPSVGCFISCRVCSTADCQCKPETPMLDRMDSWSRVSCPCGPSP